MSIECGKCKKINLKESNFCSRCGVSLKSKKKCPICLETKKNVILICGHTCCLTCINSSKINLYSNIFNLSSLLYFIIYFFQ